MSGNRMLIWLAFAVFLCAIAIALLLFRPPHSGKGSESEAATLSTGVQIRALPH